MTASLKLVENSSTLTYTGLGTMSGYKLVVFKSTSLVDLRQTTPIEMAAGQTWQTIKAELASRLV
jgi:hypothetical protein